MLILLPPSEGKLCPARGKALDLKALRDSVLNDARQQVAAELVSLCQAEPEKARKILGLSEKLGQWVQRNSELYSAATDSASRIYSGVLFGELGLTELSGDELPFVLTDGTQYAFTLDANETPNDGTYDFGLDVGDEVGNHKSFTAEEVGGHLILDTSV